MGSWNGTCGLTNMPIMCGEKIALIPIIKCGELTRGGGYCYSNDLYKPLTTALIGEYNDYGSIKNVENSHFVADFFNTNYKEAIEEVAEREGEKYPDNIEEIIDFIERGYLADMSLMMFHYDIYKRLIDEFSNRKPYKEDFTFREHIVSDYNNMKKDINEFGYEMTDTFKNLFIGRYDFGRYFASGVSDNKMAWFTNCLINNHNDILLNEMIDLIMIKNVFEYNRRLWIPSAGIGGQNQEYKLHKIIAEFIIEKEKSVTEECEEESEKENYTREALFV